MTLDPNTVLNTYFNCIWGTWNPQKFRWLSIHNSMADLITRSHFVSSHDWWICKGDLSVPTLNFVPESSEVRIIKVTRYVVSSCLCFCVKVNVVTFCIMLLTNCGEDCPTHFFQLKFTACKGRSRGGLSTSWLDVMWCDMSTPPFCLYISLLLRLGHWTCAARLS